MAVELTERQQQVQAKLKEGKKAPQIAEELGITPNAVYQTLARVRAMTGGDGAKPKSTAKPKAKPKPKPEPAAVKAATPLQALKLRQDEIQGELKSLSTEVEVAERALARMKDAQAKAQEKHADELKRIEGAMAVLRGEKGAVSRPNSKPNATKRPSRSKSAGRGTGSGVGAGHRDAEHAAPPAADTQQETPKEPVPA